MLAPSKSGGTCAQPGFSISSVLLHAPRADAVSCSRRQLGQEGDHQNQQLDHVYGTAHAQPGGCEASWVLSVTDRMHGLESSSPRVKYSPSGPAANAYRSGLTPRMLLEEGSIQGLQRFMAQERCTRDTCVLRQDCTEQVSTFSFPDIIFRIRPAAVPAPIAHWQFAKSLHR